MMRAEIIAGAVFAVLGVVAIAVLIPWFVPQRSEFGPSPAFFPTVSAVLVGTAGVGLALQRLARWRECTLRAGVGDRITLANLGHLAIAGGLLALALVGMAAIGLVVAGGTLVGALMYYMGNRRWAQIAAAALLTPGSLYAVFTWGLKIPLP